jgi:hypothetical protein
MFTISTDTISGKINIYDNFTEINYPIFNKIGDNYSLSFINLKNVKYFTDFTYSTIGSDDYKYLTTQYRISKDAKSWTDWLVLDKSINNFPPFDSKYNMFIDIKWTREGESILGSIKLLNYNLSGSLDRDVKNGLATIYLNSNNNEIVIKPPYIFKVFKLTNIEILNKGDIENTEIYYRYSQDYGRTISNWTIFNSDNIKSENINPIRFFQIEYFIKYNGSSNISIFDINLIGDFQNVSLDGQKSNLYGIRENCNCLILNIVGDTTTLESMPPGGQSSMLMAPYSTESTNLPVTTAESIAKLYQPYQQAQALTLFNKMSNDVTNLFGHDVIYVLTDPDQKGIDYTFHEYTVQNYICDAKIKVSVDNNQFPDNTGSLNNFDLTLFESFEINITKDQFKAAFGVQSRPGLNDVIWFCNLNKLYTIEHSHAIRNFNNYSIYYKVILKKFNQKANIIGASQEMQDVIDSLTKNTTLDELMGIDNQQDKKSTANQEQLRIANKAQETLRVDIYANIEKEKIENSSVTIAKTHYELSTVAAGTEAVVYRNFKFFYRKSDNLGFMAWFNINKISMTDPFNLFNYYDTSTNNGVVFTMLGNSIIATINNINYELKLSNLNSNVLSANVWYNIIINIDQRQQILTAYLYKRNVEYEDDAATLSSTKLLQLYKVSIGIGTVIIDVGDVNANILGSDMKITSIRLFNDVIPETEHNKIINKPLIGTDYKYIIFTDNANQDADMPFNPDSKISYCKIRRGTGLDT